MVREVRGLGLLAGVEFFSEDAAKLVIAACASEKLLVAYSLNNPLVIRIEPPLIIEKELLDRALGILEQAVEGTAALLESVGAITA
jgi:putrescine aminotransferase